MTELFRTILSREPLHLVYVTAILIAVIYLLLPPHLAAASFISTVGGIVHYRAGLKWGFIAFAVTFATAPIIWNVNIQIPRKLDSRLLIILLLTYLGLTYTDTTGRSDLIFYSVMVSTTMYASVGNGVVNWVLVLLWLTLFAFSSWKYLFPLLAVNLSVYLSSRFIQKLLL